jgi:hypothetical protein
MRFRREIRKAPYDVRRALHAGRIVCGSHRATHVRAHFLRAMRTLGPAWHVRDTLLHAGDRCVVALDLGEQRAERRS